MSPFLADGAADWSPLFNLGGIGVVLGWMMWRAEPRMRAIESAIDRHSATILILMLRDKDTSEPAKVQIETLLGEIKAARADRKEVDSK